MAATDTASNTWFTRLVAWFRRLMKRLFKDFGEKTKVGASVATALGILVALWVAAQGQVTVLHNTEATLQQSEYAQLSTAITALGSNVPAEQIAGLLLLTQNTSDRFMLMGKVDESAAGVFSDYTTALQILSGYLRSHGQTFLDDNSQASASFGFGYGVPPSPGLPIEMVYAADQIRYLLDMQSNVTALNGPMPPALDLSNDELTGMPWTRVNFGWITAYFKGIDLHGAFLEHSTWSKRTTLSGAYLQCADLQNATFQGANLSNADLEGAYLGNATFQGVDLSNADLEGAYVQGADFSGAKNIKKAVFKQLHGVAKWPSGQQPPGITTRSGRGWSQSACLKNRNYWPSHSTSVSTRPSPKPSSSPILSSSPIPKPSVSTGK